MGLRGPAPRPTALRLMQGAQPSKTNQREPIPTSALPTIPEELLDIAPIPAGKESDPAALKARREAESKVAAFEEVWERTVAHLVRMGIASAADTDSLVAYVAAVVNHRWSTKVLTASPLIVRAGNGSLVRNPAMVVQERSAATMKAFAEQFGLTPSARARIEVPGGASNGGLDDQNPFGQSA